MFRRAERGVAGPAAWQAVSVSSIYVLSYPIRASNPLPEPSAPSCSRLAGEWCTSSGAHPVKSNRQLVKVRAKEPQREGDGETGIPR